MSQRKFTKQMIVANAVAAWSAVGLSIIYGGHETVVPSMTFMICGLIGVYTGTGHLDYRAFLRGPGVNK